MGTIAQKLTYLNDTKQLLKENINSLGGSLTNEPFRQYASVLEGIYESLPKVSGIGASLSLSPTMVGKIKLNEIQGDTLQDGTPTPSSPVPIESVTGLQNINIGNINLKSNGTVVNYSFNSTSFTSSNSNRTIYIPIQSNTTYYINKTKLSHRFRLCFTNNVPSAELGTNEYLDASNTTNAIMVNTNYSYLCIFYWNNSDEYTEQELYNDLSIYTELNTYEVNLGKNLFDKNNANIINCLINGTTGVISSNSNCRTLYIKCNTNTTYTISRTIGARFIIGTSTNIPVAEETCNQFLVNNSASSLTITTGANDNYLCVFYYLNGTDTLTEQEILDSIQIEVGSQATSYSPYFTPIELNKIGDYEDSIKKSTGKNLFDKDTIIEGKYIDASGNFINDNNNFIGDFISIDNTKSYYISSLLGQAKRIAYYDSSKSFISRELISALGGLLTIPNNTKYVRLSCVNTSLDTLQLEIGNQATSYEPYGKVWYITKNIGKLELDGSEDEEWVKNNLTYYLKGNFPKTVFALCTHFINQGNTQWVSSDPIYKGKFTFGNTQGQIKYMPIDDNINTLDLWKTWLSNNNMEVLYTLATPVYETITNEELIEELETLNNAKSQDDTTNIIVTSEDLSMLLDVSALKGE